MARAASNVRAALAPVALALARARAAPARWLLPALGVAMATALLGSAAGGGAVAGEQAARDAIHRLPPAARTVRLSWSAGLPPRVDARARALLGELTPAPQTRSVLLLATTASVPRGGSARQTVQLAGVAPLARWVRLRSGRLPRACTRARCEVLAAGGGPSPAVLERNGTRLVVVGHGVLTSSGPLGFVPVGTSPPRPLLLAGAPAAVDALPGFATVFRTHGWSALLDTGGRPSWRLGELQGRLRAARAQITRQADGFVLDAPDGPLQLAQARAGEARHRVLLVGAGAAALLAAFTVLAATAMRRDLDGERARLERRGARRRQIVVLSVAEAAVPAVAGVLAGGLAAIAVTALRARGAEVPVGGVVTHVLLTGRAIGAAVGIAAVACALLALAARGWVGPVARVADVAALGAAGALALALARGGTGDAPGDPLPALLPPLACLVTAVLVARLAVPALRGLEVAGRRGPVGVRLAGLGLARAPSGPALTIAVVAVGCGLACFAWAYRATLHGGDRDQAAYAVPLDLTVAEGPALVPPLTAAPLARWRALAAGGPVLPVQRDVASVPRGARTVALPLLGVPATGLTALRGWRGYDASAPRALLARRLRVAGAGEARGPVVAVGDDTLSVRARGAGDAVDLAALLRGADGSVLPVSLGTPRRSGGRLTATLPAAAAGRRVVALEATERSGTAATTGHQQAENPAAPTVVGGILTLSDARLGRRRLPLQDWVARGPLVVTSSGGRALYLDYRFDRPGRALLGPAQPGADTVLPVVVDRATATSAGPHGVLPLTVDGERLQARVVGTVARFATVPASADGVVVADAAALTAVREARSPGSARPQELWIGVAAGAAERRVRGALHAGALRALTHASRRADERRLRSDPLARELVRTLAGAAAVALALAALGVLVAVALALRDDAAELFDLEALGVAPRTLRADVRLRAAVIAVLGVGAGLAVAVLLARLVVSAVQVTAAGVVPVPPLVVVTPLWTWALSVLAFLMTVALGVGVLTRHALGGRAPRRAAEVAP